jgi:hypothetical protein
VAVCYAIHRVSLRILGGFKHLRPASRTCIGGAARRTRTSRRVMPLGGTDGAGAAQVRHVTLASVCAGQKARGRPLGGGRACYFWLPASAVLPPKA